MFNVEFLVSRSRYTAMGSIELTVFLLSARLRLCMLNAHGFSLQVATTAHTEARSLLAVVVSA